MQLEVLLSCMYQADTSIVYKSHITGDVLILNQCNQEKQEQIHIGNQRIRMISTIQRGLSNSRNLAIHLSNHDICLLCDDDEILAMNYEKIILDHFNALPDADVIAFHVANKITKLKPKTQRIRYLKSLRISSVQIAFRADRIKQKEIAFDNKLGAGTGNGCGEENKFLWDCLKQGLKIYYVPETIATLETECSTWFTAYDKKFFRQRGHTTRYIMGAFPAILYGIYYLIAKHNLYKNTISAREAARSLFIGIYENPIHYF